MATVFREISIAADADEAWSAVQDVAAVHRRLAPGLVTNVRLDADVREVTFANGLVIQERIVSVDHALLRVAYTALNRAQHHQASMQIFPVGENRCRFVWITDVLPDEVAPRFAAVMDQALPLIAQTLSAVSTKV